MAACDPNRTLAAARKTRYGTGEMLGWLVERGIEPYIPVWDKARRKDGTFSREDFVFDKDRDAYTCRNGKPLRTTGTVHDGKTLRYRASTSDCTGCPLKPRCCPNTPARYIPRDIHEGARDHARSRAVNLMTAYEQART